MRHDEADTRPVEIERSDAIDAAGGLLLLAANTRAAARRRRYAGPDWAGFRAQARETADIYEAAARRIQAAADELL